MVTEEIKKQRGLRIRDVRQQLYMSRKAFSKKHNIPYPTLQNWEDGRFGGLSKRGAKILATVFKEDGIECSPQWLLEGKGNKPLPIPSLRLRISESEVTRYGAIQNELKAFYENNPQAVHTIITDDAMEPRFCKGEYVAGIQYKAELSYKLINMDCIIHTKMGKVLVKRVVAIEDKKLKLKNLNDDKIVFLKINDLMYIAPIIWARREIYP